MLESGIAFCYAQMLVDREFVRMVKKVMQGIAVHKDTLALEVIKAVGAGGNYLMEEHTLKYMRQEQSRAKLIDRRTRKGWEETGGQDMITRARSEARQILAGYRPMPLDPKVAARLRQIVQEAEDELK
ncbi:hypothetical protein DCMF_25370 [Candidatus Formimonas warabiya]|uniref:Trimethylamine methyltransferase n=1 Tax=Formimonas warabiya TaxID=1761012 RepID=A0A3G1L2M8_FORW1|nr:hypothetical protein DCMF_25370 [Candidatus Formimonas warabiya]